MGIETKGIEYKEQEERANSNLLVGCRKGESLKSPVPKAVPST